MSLNILERISTPTKKTTVKRSEILGGAVRIVKGAHGSGRKLRTFPALVLAWGRMAGGEAGRSFRFVKMSPHESHFFISSSAISAVSTTTESQSLRSSE